MMISLIRTSLILVLLFLASLANAAPGTLSNSPLFLSTATEPNVFFLLDDSGSMEWDALVQNGVSGLPDVGGWSSNYYVLPTANNGLDKSYISIGCSPTCYPYVVPSVTAVSDAWRVRNSDFNALYYDPEVTYQPWQGNDALGSALYSDAVANAAVVDPSGVVSGTFNLTQNITFYNYAPSEGGWFVDTIFPASYYSWTDSDSDNVVDTSDAHTLVEIKPAVTSYTGGVDRSDCTTVPVCSYAEEIQNFANWFSYYRKRSYVAKKAIGNVVNATDKKRMGLHVYNDGLITNAISVSSAANKTTLLQNIYGTDISCDGSGCPGTPARSALKSVGDLFEGASSPIVSAAEGGACQQNFDVVLSDGFWNGSTPSGIGNADGDGDTSFDGGAYADTYSTTLADVAMHYYERDLKTGLSNSVPTVANVDTADHQHLVTFSVAFGVSGTLDPVTTSPTDAGFNWPDPTDVQDDERIDDLWHAAYNGRGKFLSAQNPVQLTQGLKDALAAISDRTGSAAAVAFNSSSLNANSDVYLALFNSTAWSGDLKSYPLDPNTGAISSTANWGAASVLNLRDLSVSPRKILTHDGSDGVAFQWANLSVAQKNDLRTNSAGGTDSDAIAQARLNFIRGDRSNEGSGNNFRVRSSRLGDIVHSEPVYVGKPGLAWPDTAPFPTGTSAYSLFSSSVTRDGVIYAGGNDGMLHGFKESDGSEVLSYVPASVFSTDSGAGLHYLTESSYNHKYYVDLGAVVADAYIKGDALGTAAWRTVLLGGLRGGGRGLFALDVTDPSTFLEANAASLVLWEFTNADDPDLGYSFSQPTIALMNNGKWAAILGNGYNDDPGGSGEAKLFIVYLEGGLDGSWAATDYVEITTGIGSTADRNGLSTPLVIDSDGDGDADRVYAGDLKGNMWVFDLSDTSDSSWSVAYKQGMTPKPLFTALNNQPITSAPYVISHPTEAASGNGLNRLVFFGTGQYLAQGDNLDVNGQSFYGVWDRGTKELSRTNLVAQTFESGFPADARVITDNSVAYSANGASKKYGWYIDLPESGERVASNAFVRGDIVFFNTMTPSSDPCTYGGSSWAMSVKALNGGRPGSSVFDYNGDGYVNTSDKVSDGSISLVAAGKKISVGLAAGSSFLGNNRYTPTTSTEDGDDIQRDVIEGLGSGDTGRLSWQELTR
ncbi:pilus assembly protein [Pseudomonadota bacterium]